MYLYFKAFVNIYVNSHGSDILSSKVVAFITFKSSRQVSWAYNTSK